MPKGLWPRHHSARKTWLHRLDLMAGHLNVLLVAIAIGLATLDLTFLLSEQIIDHLPQMTSTYTVQQTTVSPGWNSDQLGPP